MENYEGRYAMMKILIRFGDLMLKGKNKNTFINKLANHLRKKYRDLDVKVINKHDQSILDFNESDLEEVEKRLKQIPGIHSYSIIVESSKDINDIVSKAVSLLDKDLSNDKEYRFKIETRRSDKNFKQTSLEFTQEIAPLILNKSNKKLIVDVKNPEVVLTINIRFETVYIYLNSKRAMGGYPSQIAGKGLLMLSGGIDSPVAGFLSIKQGVDLELIHFESTPLTPLESINKVTDLAAKLAVFLPDNKIKLHVVPFLPIHESLLNNVDESYIITIMRRMMYRIAERFADKNKIDILINGDSVGQVASQTLSSLRVVENVTNIPVIRPLATYDKQDIIKIAYDIDTFDISVRPFSDCCSVYVPKNPVIRPTIAKAVEEENKFDYETMINETLKNIKTLVINKDFKKDLSLYGFTFLESYENMVVENDWINK